MIRIVLIRVCRDRRDETLVRELLFGETRDQLQDLRVSIAPAAKQLGRINVARRGNDLFVPRIRIGVVVRPPLARPQARDAVDADLLPRAKMREHVLEGPSRGEPQREAIRGKRIQYRA